MEDHRDATRELQAVAARAEQYRWLLMRVAPWAFPLVWPGDPMPLALEEKIQRELDRQPEREAPFVHRPDDEDQLNLEL